MGRKRRLEVSFDEEGRKEFLLGFRKRKLERRRHGLAMQALKDRKELLETRQELRENRRASRGLKRAVSEEEKTPGEAAAKEESVTVEEKFSDNFSKEHFGAGVTVSTTLNVDPDEEDSDQETLLLKREGLKKAMERKRLYGDSRDDEQRNAHSLATFKRKIKQLPMKKRKNAKARRSTEAAGSRAGSSGKSRSKKKKKR